MKGFSIKVLLAIALMVSMSITAFAAVQVLWQPTRYTYVLNEHGGFLSDTYRGTVSVRGADRWFNPYLGELVYFEWVKLTYNVQGRESCVMVKSGNAFNKNQIVKTITVKDKWNNGPVTTARYDFSDVVVYQEGNNGLAPRSSRP